MGSAFARRLTMAPTTASGWPRRFKSSANDASRRINDRWHVIVGSSTSASSKATGSDSLSRSVRIQSRLISALTASARVAPERNSVSALVCATGHPAPPGWTSGPIADRDGSRPRVTGPPPSRSRPPAHEHGTEQALLLCHVRIDQLAGHAVQHDAGRHQSQKSGNEVERHATPRVGNLELGVTKRHQAQADPAVQPTALPMPHQQIERSHPGEDEQRQSGLQREGTGDRRPGSGQEHRSGRETRSSDDPPKPGRPSWPVLGGRGQHRPVPSGARRPESPSRRRRPL